VSKLQLCERKFTTEKVPRGRVVHKLGQLWSFWRENGKNGEEWIFAACGKTTDFNNLIFSVEKCE
jgi:hypothetical protein